MVVFPCPPRREGEQLSGTEDGVVIFGSLGLCRLDIVAGGNSLGVFTLTSSAPSSPFIAARDYWYWRAGVTPWPSMFELHYAPQVPLPSTTPEVHPQLRFSGAPDEQDLSASGLSVWRVRRGELVQGSPVYEDIGFLTRAGNGALSWYADTTPGPGYFAVPAGTWLRLVHLDNTNLVVQAVRALPGVVD